jgi:hypothetical protein
MKMTLLLLVAALLALGSAKYVTINTCTDKLTCQSSTCTKQTLPADSCIPNNNNGSQTLTCIPYAALYLSKYKYSDSSCKTPFGSEVIGCDRCFPINSSLAQFASPRCLISDAGVPFVNVSLCLKEANPQNCGCNDAVVAAQWILGQCQAADGGQHYEVLKSLFPCAQVLQMAYATPDCSGAAVQQIWPSGVCSNGGFVHCHGDF